MFFRIPLTVIDKGLPEKGFIKYLCTSHAAQLKYLMQFSSSDLKLAIFKIKLV